MFDLLDLFIKVDPRLLILAIGFLDLLWWLRR